MATWETAEGRAQTVLDRWQSVQDSPQFTEIHPEAQRFTELLVNDLGWIVRGMEHTRDKLREQGLYVDMDAEP